MAGRRRRKRKEPQGSGRRPKRPKKTPPGAPARPKEPRNGHDVAAVPGLTDLLNRAAAGDREAEDRLANLVYEELHRQARRALVDQPPDASVEVTGLVHEAYMKLLRRPGMRWKDRRHFLGTAAIAMRTILVDHARARKRGKRRARGERVALDCVLAEYERPSRGGEFDIEALSRGLEELAAVDRAAAEVVHLRFFLGLKLPQIAKVTGRGLRSVERLWSEARTWLRRRLEE